MKNLESHLDDDMINEVMNKCDQEGITDFYSIQTAIQEKGGVPSNKQLNQQICENLAKQSSTHIKLEYEKQEVKMKTIPLKIIQPKEDELCIDELVIEIETELPLKGKSATLLILNTNNEVVEEKKFKELSQKLVHPLNNYKPGRYYWKLVIDYDTWVDRVFICTPFYYALLKHTL